MCLLDEEVMPNHKHHSDTFWIFYSTQDHLFGHNTPNNWTKKAYKQSCHQLSENLFINNLQTINISYKHKQYSHECRIPRVKNISPTFMLSNIFYSSILRKKFDLPCNLVYEHSNSAHLLSSSNLSIRLIGSLKKRLHIRTVLPLYCFRLSFIKCMKNNAHIYMWVGEYFQFLS